MSTNVYGQARRMGGITFYNLDVLLISVVASIAGVIPPSDLHRIR